LRCAAASRERIISTLILFPLRSLRGRLNRSVQHFRNISLQGF
jgi:hypothetical protein